MCGIAGFFALRDRRVTPADEQRVRRAALTLERRGPDASGYWADQRVALGHRRLSVIDLSDRAAQPMPSHDGRVIVSFNGEIYNFQDVRRELERDGAIFRTTSDTEVIAEGLARWGHERLLPRLNGMFAIASWQPAAQRLLLVRDRFGVKPLAFATFADALVFGSTVTAAIAAAGVDPPIDRQAVAGYLEMMCVPGDRAIFAGVEKLPPATWLEIDAEGRRTAGVFWKPPRDLRAEITERQALDELDELLSAAVKRRLIADVPVGVFLSGGIDSSLVALYAARHQPGIKSFTIGFTEAAFDESATAAEVAAAAGTTHRVKTMAAADLLADVEAAAAAFDEPFGDPSSVPTFAVSREARKEVTVVLSGDGGDELLAGYPYHRWIRTFARLHGLTPFAARRAAGAVLKRAPLPHRARMAAAALDQRTLPDVYSYMRGGLKEVELADLMPDGPARNTADRFAAALADPRDWTEYLLLDFTHYLVDDVNVKVDRASMCHSLEVRSPFLDVTVVDWLLRLPRRFKWRDGAGKWITRALLRRHVRPQVASAPKKGFSVPIRVWLGRDLRARLQELPARDWDRFGVDARGVATLVDEHLSGRRMHDSTLWSLWMLAAWDAGRR